MKIVKNYLIVDQKQETIRNTVILFLSGTQVMLLVASETGHVYTFATKKLQPMITSEAGKALIQTCLNSPDEPDFEGEYFHLKSDWESEYFLLPLDFEGEYFLLQSDWDSEYFLLPLHWTSFYNRLRS